MNDAIRAQIESLATLRLPDLQARFAEVVGEETRAVNKVYLVRRITEALEAQAAEQQANQRAKAEEKPAAEPDSDPEPVKLTKLTVDELRSAYVEVIGRETSSTNRSYLIWKLREAEKGRIPIGPRRARRTDGEAPDIKVLPLRMEAGVVEQLDAARERLGLKSRMELFRRSLHAFLLEAGEVRVAEMFAPEA